MLTPSWINDGSEIPDPFGHGERAVQWLRRLRHPSSRLPGNAFQLDPWQERIVRAIEGPRHEDGRRIVRRVTMCVPRGNRKTSLCAALTLLNLMGPDRRPGSLIVSAAAAHEQAKELYQEAALIAESDPRMRKHLDCADYRARILFPAERSRYQAVSSEGNTLLGKTPKVIIADELLAWLGEPGRRQWKALQSAMSKISDTLMIVATTSGRGQSDLGWDVIDYARKVQTGQIEDPSTLPVLFMAEKDDEWQNESLWHAVNPGLKHGYPDIEGLRNDAEKAKHSIFDRETFLQFNLNVWMDQSTSPFVDMKIYDQGRMPVDLDEVEANQTPLYLGVDLSKVEDLTVIVAAWSDGDGGFHVHPWFFCPGENLREREEKQGVPYVAWAEQGFITPTPGNVVDLRAIEDHIRELCARLNVKEVAFDPTYGRSMMANLNEDGIPAVEFRQGWVSMAPAVQTLERSIIGRKFRHGGHPILRWNFENIQVETDKAGNRQFHKGKSGNKIDGAVAAVMACARCEAGAEHSVYDAPWFDPIEMGAF